MLVGKYRLDVFRVTYATVVGKTVSPSLVDLDFDALERNVYQIGLELRRPVYYRLIDLLLSNRSEIERARRLEIPEVRNIVAKYIVFKLKNRENQAVTKEDLIRLAKYFPVKGKAKIQGRTVNVYMIFPTKRNLRDFKIDEEDIEYNARTLLADLVRVNALVKPETNSIEIGGFRFTFNEEDFPTVLKKLGLPIPPSKLKSVLARKMRKTLRRPVNETYSDENLVFVTTLLHYSNSKISINASTRIKTYPKAEVWGTYENDLLIYSTRVETDIYNIEQAILEVYKKLEQYHNIEPKLEEIKKFADTYGYRYKKTLIQSQTPSVTLKRGNVEVTINIGEKYTGTIRIFKRHDNLYVSFDKIYEALGNNVVISVSYDIVRVAIPFTLDSLDALDNIVLEAKSKLEKILQSEAPFLGPVAVNTTSQNKADMVALYLLRAVDISFIIKHNRGGSVNTVVNAVDEIVRAALPRALYMLLSKRYEEYGYRLAEVGEFETILALLKAGIVRKENEDIYIYDKPLTRILSEIGENIEMKDVKYYTMKIRELIDKYEAFTRLPWKEIIQQYA